MLNIYVSDEYKQIGTRSVYKTKEIEEIVPD